ncbi:coenzyme PQQ synthesis protein C family protein [mine drainage metagenome]|uniref:Coenzyme PQQ synthesis protein C family protein n=1 Tax=mine drainage metagenome TaxID=410659 RepID=T1CQ22_9ZZZZ
MPSAWGAGIAGHAGIVPEPTEKHDYLQRMQPTMTTLREMDTAIRTRHLLKHPFYTAWSRGELSLDTLRQYAGQYYHFESNFPRYVGGAYARLQRAEDRRILLENLQDEEGSSPTHPELWIDFARGIGARWSARRPPAPARATRNLCSTYEALTIGAGQAAPALGALYAYEAQFAEVAAEKSRGLRAFYGVRAKSAHEFFRVHTVADVEHSAAERAVLARELRASPSVGPATGRAVDRTLGAWWSFLDSFAG